LNGIELAEVETLFEQLFVKPKNNKGDVVCKK
jgi:hypothetical protein